MHSILGLVNTGVYPWENQHFFSSLLFYLWLIWILAERSDNIQISYIANIQTNKINKLAATYIYKVGAVIPPSLMVFMWLYVCTQMLIITTMQYSISLVLCICVRLQSYRFPIPSCTGQRPIHKNIHLHPKIWYAHLARLEHNHKYDLFEWNLRNFEFDS